MSRESQLKLVEYACGTLCFSDRVNRASKFFSTKFCHILPNWTYFAIIDNFSPCWIGELNTKLEL